MHTYPASASIVFCQGYYSREWSAFDLYWPSLQPSRFIPGCHCFSQSYMGIVVGAAEQSLLGEPLATCSPPERNSQHRSSLGRLPVTFLAQQHSHSTSRPWFKYPLILHLRYIYQRWQHCREHGMYLRTYPAFNQTDLSFQAGLSFWIAAVTIAWKTRYWRYTYWCFFLILKEAKFLLLLRMTDDRLRSRGRESTLKSIQKSSILVLLVSWPTASTKAAWIEGLSWKRVSCWVGSINKLPPPPKKKEQCKNCPWISEVGFLPSGF